jgi:hypothetical protein
MVFDLYSYLELYSGHDMKSTEPPHHTLDKPTLSNMALTKLATVRFFLSAIPFDSGE